MAVSCGLGWRGLHGTLEGDFILVAGRPVAARSFLVDLP